jgi:hypothetical protein
MNKTLLSATSNLTTLRNCSITYRLNEDKRSITISSEGKQFPWGIMKNEVKSDRAYFKKSKAEIKNMFIYFVVIWYFVVTSVLSNKLGWYLQNNLPTSSDHHLGRGVLS